MAKDDQKAADEDEDLDDASKDVSDPPVGGGGAAAADETDDSDDPPRDDDDSSDEADPPDEDEDEADDDADDKAAEQAAEDDDPLPAPLPKAQGVQAVTPPPPAASLAKSVTTFVVVLAVLFAGFFVLGNAESPFSEGPKWRIGQTVSVDLTLDPADDTKLSCAAKADIGGKHCEYEDKTTKFAGQLKDETMLRPYTTLDSQHLLAAGVWSSPEIEKGKRPTGRFTVKCDFKVEGKVNAPAVRWDVAGAWNEKNEEWFAGAVSNCKLQK